MADSITGLLPDNQEIFRVAPNWVGLPLKFQPTIETFGTKQVERLVEFVNTIPEIIEFSYLVETKAEEKEISDFFESRKGKWKSFWVQSYRNEFELALDGSIGDPSLTVYDDDFDYAGYERIYLQLRSGDLIVRKITNITPIVDDQLALALDTQLDRDIEISDVLEFGRLYLVRFNTDELNWTYQSRDVCEAKLSFLEVIAQYGEPSVTVLAPNGGEVLETTDATTISWSTQNLSTSDFVRISLRDNGVEVLEIDDFAPNVGSYTWVIPQDQTPSNYTVRVESATDSNVFDDSNAVFEIAKKPEVVTILSPNGGEVIERETTISISWANQGFTEDVEIEIAFNTSGGTIPGLGEKLVGTFPYTVTSTTFFLDTSVLPRTNYRIRADVQKAGAPFQVWDLSDGDFEITERQRSINITNSFNAIYAPGNLINLTWDTTNFLPGEDVQIDQEEQNFFNSSVYNSRQTIIVPNTGSYTITLVPENFNRTTPVSRIRISRILTTSGTVEAISPLFAIN